MINNICPVCKAVISENERLCPFCGTELRQKTQNEKKEKNSSSYYKRDDDYSVQKSQSSYVPYRPNNTNNFPPPQRYNNYSQVNNTQNKSGAGKRIVIALIITFVIVFGFLFTVGMLISIGEDIQYNEVQSVVDNDVEVIKIPSIPSEDTKPTGKVPGNTNLYQNDKYLIFNLADTVYPEDGGKYIRNYYIYVDKPVDENVEFSCDEYSGDIDAEGYNVSFNLYGNYEDRAEYIYVTGDEELTKLDSLKIGGLTFEVYMIKDDNSYTYEFLSEPINSGEDYVKVHYFSVNDEIIDYKDIIRYANHTKDDVIE